MDRPVIADVALLQLPQIPDRRGNLTFVEQDRHIPFPIARVYWIYDVPGGESREAHAFRAQAEVIIALSGSFEVIVDDGAKRKTIRLDHANQGLYVPNLIWREMFNFATNSVAYVLTNCAYAEDDYIRDYQAYLALRA